MRIVHNLDSFINIGIKDNQLLISACKDSYLRRSPTIMQCERSNLVSASGSLECLE